MGTREGTIKRGFVLLLLVMLAAMAVLTGLVFAASREGAVLVLGGVLMLCAVGAMVALMQVVAVRLQRFSDGLCVRMDALLDGNGRDAPLAAANDSEMLFDRINHRLTRLYGVQEAKEQQLAKERQQLQSLVSDIAHQVRQPLASLQMISDTLIEQPVSAVEQQEFLYSLRSQADKLAFLMQALVKTSRLEAGLIHIQKQPVPLYETVAQALHTSVTQAARKQIAVSVDCPDTLVVSHDSRWTAEALANLVDNAVKYTPAGGHIAVTVEAGEMYIVLTVRDDGPGIPEREQAQVFARFYRGSAAQGDGVGIGLYLAREIIMRQGGYIRLVSEPGHGAAFSIMLPLRD